MANSAVAVVGGRNLWGEKVHVPVGFREGDWLCNLCKNHNIVGKHHCQRCGNPKPLVGPNSAGVPVGSHPLVGSTEFKAPPTQVAADGSAAGQPNAPATIHPGDWVCGHCRNCNYSARTLCNRCGAGRDGLAKKATPETVVGRREDWICPSCENHNWADKQNCNRCGTVKPTDKQLRRHAAQSAADAAQVRAAAAAAPPAAVPPPDPAAAAALAALTGGLKEEDAEEEDDGDRMLPDDDSSEDTPVPRQMRRGKLVPKIPAGWRQLDVFKDSVPITKVEPVKPKRKVKPKKPAAPAKAPDALDIIRMQAQELDTTLHSCKREEELAVKRARRKEAEAAVVRDRLMLREQGFEVAIPEQSAELRKRRQRGEGYYEMRERQWNEANKLLEHLEQEAQRRAQEATLRPLKRNRTAPPAPSPPPGAGPRGNDEDTSESEGGAAPPPADPAAAAAAAAERRQAAAAATAEAAAPAPPAECAEEGSTEGRPAPAPPHPAQPTEPSAAAQMAGAAAIARAAGQEPPPPPKKPPPPPPDVDKLVNEIFELFDDDRDNELSWEEFSVMCRALAGGDEARARAPPRDAFAAAHGGAGASRFALGTLLRRQTPRALRKTADMIRKYRRTLVQEPDPHPDTAPELRGGRRTGILEGRGAPSEA